jgi:SAM-dependent methyltransferase
MPAFRDHFAFAAQSYASYRPHYPDSLFAWLAANTRQTERAWDCGTGSGQAAVALAQHYDEVVASDPSMAQLSSAERHAAVAYVAMPAERVALSDQSIDLVTVAQALHWFDLSFFFAETDRVLRPGGALAVWSYGLLTIDAEIDAVLGHLYRDTLGSYWPAERAMVDQGYAGITLPYPEIHTPDVAMDATWTREQLVGYLATWSAVGRYRRAVGADPLPDTRRRLEALWPAEEARRIRWPLVLRVAGKPM